MLWNRGCRLPWRQRLRRGEDICWDERDPTRVRLNAERSYAVRYALNVSAMHPVEKAGAIFLRQTPCGAFTETLPLYFSAECVADRPQTLQYAAILYPRVDGGCEAELSLVLDAKSALCVERAVLDIAEL